MRDPRLTSPEAIHRYREQRRTLRLDVTGDVVTELLAISQPLPMVNIGLGGCLIDSPSPLVLGSRHQLTVRTADGWTTRVEACVVHCRRTTRPGGDPRYAIGFMFAPTREQRADHVVDTLIDKVTASLTFE